MKRPVFQRPNGAAFRTKSFCVGSYSAALTAVALAVAVAVNLVVGALPASATQFDTSENQLYTISEQTKEIVSGLSEDVTVYHLAQSGSEDSVISGVLERYTALGEHLRVEKKDPVVYPAFAAQYTNESLQNNSLIVVCGERSRYIPYSDIYVTDYSQYFMTGETTTTFALESELTSAVDYVTAQSLPTLYLLTGHGEAELPASLLSAVEKQNVAVESLSLLTADAVPSDADALLIYSPARDLSEIERDLLLAYLNEGGSLLLATDYSETAMPNLDAVAAACGLSRVSGIVVEGDADHSLRGYAHYLLPEISSHAVTDPLIDGGYYALFPLAQGLVTAETLPDGVSVTELLTTSGEAFSKTAAYSAETLDFEEGDLAGPFAVAAAAVKETDGGTARLVWFTSSMAFSDEVNQIVSGANHDLFLNAVGWMCEHESAISIHAKSLAESRLTLTAGQSRLWTILFVLAVPVLFLAAGIAIWLRRRARG